MPQASKSNYRRPVGGSLRRGRFFGFLSILVSSCLGFIGFRVDKCWGFTTLGSLLGFLFSRVPYCFGILAQAHQTIITVDEAAGTTLPEATPEMIRALLFTSMALSVHYVAVEQGFQSKMLSATKAAVS